MGPLEGPRTIKILNSPKLQGRSWVLDGEEVEVISHSASHPSNSSPSQPPSKRFQSQVIPSTPRNFWPTLATIPTSIPPASPHSSHTRPALNAAVRPSHVQQSRNSPIVSSQQLQPVASTSRRREELSPLLFPAAQVFQCRLNGLSKLTEKIQIQPVIIRILWPGYLGGLIKIVGR
ncbi:hypothetical protein O181_040786 [Austropuccinia psidii MF-1]|uniref:Uncharacterized protein n=1 Tax=Austropuccinia psidii MF-1 TaxID=1389203 RepID=A0A9Q3HDQ0_9BASI|nr:hypothetical protein [Austropuccinia psidii MF-1]